MPRKLTTEEFIAKAQEKHGDKYGYDRVQYVNNRTDVEIYCKTCQKYFKQSPDSHLQGKGCRDCGYKASHPIMSFEEFVHRARAVHGDKYDYSQVKIKTVSDDVTIICPEHGPFLQRPINHYKMKQGCPKCGFKKLGVNKRHTLEKFLQLAKEKHGDKYDYSLVTEYKNGNTPVKIICKTCGKTFEQKPKMHIMGHGCTYCANNIPIGTEEFIRRAIEVWGDKYSYDKVEYESNKKKVVVTCPTHGDFKTTAYDFLKGHGCPKCGIESVKKKRRRNPKDLLLLANEVHHGKYDYSKADFINKRKKITIICPEHGEFEQSLGNHLNGQGCPKCKAEKQAELFSKSADDFIKEAREVHGNRYDYSLVKYKNNKTDVIVICPKHGKFKVAPQDHIAGGNGCPICSESKLERRVRIALDKRGIKFDHPKRDFEWLRYERKQHLDFYLPEPYNVAIECQGVQHFVADERSGEEGLALRQKMDSNKYNLCKEHGIRILYFSTKEPYLPNVYLDKIYLTIGELIEEINRLKE